MQAVDDLAELPARAVDKVRQVGHKVAGGGAKSVTKDKKQVKKSYSHLNSGAGRVRIEAGMDVEQNVMDLLRRKRNEFLGAISVCVKELYRSVKVVYPDVKTAEADDKFIRTDDGSYQYVVSFVTPDGEVFEVLFTLYFKVTPDVDVRVYFRCVVGSRDVLSFPVSIPADFKMVVPKQVVDVLAKEGVL
jgi:hypothetical protein